MNRHFDKKHFNFKTVAALLAALLSGCANFLTGPDKIGSKDVGNAGAEVLSYDPVDYNCPYSPNVVPDYDWMLDGSGHFEVCSHKENQTDLLVHGQTHYSDEICLFPAEVVNSTGQIFLKLDLATNGLLYKCIQADEGGVAARFDFTNFNALFIVEKPYLNQMLSCLSGPAGPSYFACPNNPGYYSYGRFRQ